MADGPPPVQRVQLRGALPPSEPRSVPLVGLQPLHSAEPPPQKAPVEVQSHVERRLGRQLHDIAIHRGRASAEGLARIGAAAATVAGEVHLPAERGSLRSEPARSLLAHELAHVTQQRRLGRSLPREDSPAGRALEHEAAQVASALPLAPAPATPDAKSLVAAATTNVTGTPSVQAEVQRVPQPQPVPAPSAAGPLGAAGAGNLEELASRLYERIRTRLRAELLVERERAGLLADLR